MILSLDQLRAAAGSYPPFSANNHVLNFGYWKKDKSREMNFFIIAGLIEIFIIIFAKYE